MDDARFIFPALSIAKPALSCATTSLGNAQPAFSYTMQKAGNVIEKAGNAIYTLRIAIHKAGNTQPKAANAIHKASIAFATSKTRQFHRKPSSICLNSAKSSNNAQQASLAISQPDGIAAPNSGRAALPRRLNDQAKPQLCPTSCFVSFTRNYPSRFPTG